MQAVILAAGMGSRIREWHLLPKGFICLGKQPIIQESVQALKQAGIHDILVVTGYAAHYYHTFAKENNIATTFNADYHRYGSLYSLYCAKDWITDDFLLLESDIIYEFKAIESILASPHRNVILLSGETCASDEVYVEAEHQKLIRMSKQKNQLDEAKIIGEFVGINKLSLSDYRQLINQLKQNPSILQQGHYDEHGIVTITHYTDVFCLKMGDLLWSEIDNYFQLNRAKTIYLHLIQGRARQQALIL